MLRQGKWEIEVVAPTCFESFLPAVKVHGCEFVVVGVGQERVEGLGLVDERSAVRRKVWETIAHGGGGGGGGCLQGK